MQAERLEDGAFQVCCRMDSTAEDVRATLTDIHALLQDQEMAPPPDNNWELVVAEVLNNIVEHAYEDRAGGDILLRLVFTTDRLAVEFTDFGRPMPCGTLPFGAPVDLDVSEQDLPEGGFGWFLIRSLAENLDYHHDGDRNRLTLSIPLG